MVFSFCKEGVVLDYHLDCSRRVTPPRCIPPPPMTNLSLSLSVSVRHEGWKPRISFRFDFLALSRASPLELSFFRSFSSSRGGSLSASVPFFFFCFSLLFFSPFRIGRAQGVVLAENPRGSTSLARGETSPESARGVSRRLKLAREPGKEGDEEQAQEWKWKSPPTRRAAPASHGSHPSFRWGRTCRVFNLSSRRRWWFLPFSSSSSSSSSASSSSSSSVRLGESCPFFHAGATSRAPNLNLTGLVRLFAHPFPSTIAHRRVMKSMDVLLSTCLYRFAIGIWNDANYFVTLSFSSSLSERSFRRDPRILISILPQNRAITWASVTNVGY